MKKGIYIILIFLFSFYLIAEDFITYKVKEKETLWSISKKYNITLEELILFNNIKDVTTLKSGTEIKIPIKKTESENYEEYIFKEGDTIWKISRKYGINAQDILKINNIVDPSKIKINSKIKIPKNKEEKKVKEINLDNQIIHIVKKKETLWSIAKLYKVSINEIKELNNINENKIKEGEKIIIPKKLEYLDFPLPLSGQIKTFSSAHFSGIYIYPENNNKVNCMEKGIISYFDMVPGFGLTIFIRHNDDLISTYSGFEKVFVKEGDIVEKMTPIGEVLYSEEKKNPILVSIQYKGKSLKFDTNTKKFIKIPF